MQELYLLFEEIFLKVGRIDSKCGHKIIVFDHHFFHLAAVTVQGIDRLFMKTEKEIILGLAEGFGNYEVGGPRARHLRSAQLTFAEPDEVWEDNPKTRAKWTYVKEFSSQPYQFTVALVDERPEEGRIRVPVSSFPCKRGDVKKWRQGRLMYPENTKAAP